MKVFIAYAPEDEVLKKELEEHLSLLKKQGIISLWHTGYLRAGDAFEEEISRQIKEAQIILLLISSDFLASDIADNPEIAAALQRQQKDNAVSVIPVILRDCVWRIGDFARLTPLPIDGKPVTVLRYWPTRDEAFKNVALGVKKVADHIYGRKNDIYPSENLGEIVQASDKENKAAHERTVTRQLFKKIGFGGLAFIGAAAIVFVLWRFVLGAGGHNELQDAFLRKSLKGTWINSNYWQSTLFISKLQFADNQVAVFSKEGNQEYYWGKQPVEVESGKVEVKYDKWGIEFSIEPQVDKAQKIISSLITIYWRADAPASVKVANDTLLRPELAFERHLEQIQKALKDDTTMPSSPDSSDITPPILNKSALNDSMAAILYEATPVETLKVSPSKMLDWERYNTDYKVMSDFLPLIKNAQRVDSTLGKPFMMNIDVIQRVATTSKKMPLKDARGEVKAKYVNTDVMRNLRQK